MPMYGFICPQCGATTEAFGPIRVGPPAMRCEACSVIEMVDGHHEIVGTPMKRDYRTDAPFIAPVTQSVYSPSLGTMISDQRQVDEAMKRITEESVIRTGYEPKLVAHHRSEIGPATESHRDPTGQALENAMKAAHDGARGKSNKAAFDAA